MQARRTHNLTNALHHAAADGTLLVAADYDGTLAPIVTEPTKAFPDAAAVSALQALEQLPNTSAAIITGRTLEQLHALIGRLTGIDLVGCHGSETGEDFHASLTVATRDLAAQITTELETIAADHPGVHIEAKPTGAALHYREAQPGRIPGILGRIHDLVQDLSGVTTNPGKMVIELSAVEGDKGKALNDLRMVHGATTTVFLGDDTTDERAFEVLGQDDIGIKVGNGATAAEYRVEDTNAVRDVLEHLLELRSGQG